MEGDDGLEISGQLVTVEEDSDELYTEEAREAIWFLIELAAATFDLEGEDFAEMGDVAVLVDAGVGDRMGLLLLML